jgi:hypothetical protein
LHGPEISYLVNGLNGLVSEGTSDAYAACVLSLIGNPGVMSKLSINALADAERYTLDEMVRRFTDGMVNCLSKPRMRRSGVS